MYHFVTFVILAIVACFSKAEVQLTKGVNTTVIFDGDELNIELTHSQGENETLTLCFGTSTDTVYSPCPKGFIRFTDRVEGLAALYKLNRNGRITGKEIDKHIAVVFEKDGSLNVTLQELPSGASVTLSNAELRGMTTMITEVAIKEHSDSNTTLAWISRVAIILFLVLLVIGAILLYFCWYRKRTHRPVPVTVQPVPVTMPEVNVPPSREGLAESSGATTTTKPTTTLSDEKAQKPGAPASAPVANVVLPVKEAERAPLLSASAENTTAGSNTKIEETKKVKEKS